MTRAKPRYNIANATDSLPQVSVSNFDKNDERVTCVSCRFRYSTVRDFCPMCGEQASAESEALDAAPQASRSSLKFNRESWTPLRERSRPGLGKTLAVVSIVGLVSVGSYFTLRSKTIVNSPAAVHSDEVPTVRPYAPRAVAPSNETKAPPLVDEKFHPAQPQPAADISSETNDDDPVELWSRVRQGDPQAEVALAKLYLSGTALERNCEQAHMLLLAASRKHDKVADQVLGSDYQQQCP